MASVASWLYLLWLYLLWQVPYPRDASGAVSALVHPRLSRGDFRPLRRGAPTTPTALHLLHCYTTPTTLLHYTYCTTPTTLLYYTYHTYCTTPITLHLLYYTHPCSLS